VILKDRFSIREFRTTLVELSPIASAESIGRKE
jgi:hypothetical protein